MKLLSPVGSKEALVAAVSNGADAVYLGSKLFNARRLASNFTTDELKTAVEYAHLNNVKVYLTLNILIKNHEIPAFLNQLSLAYQVNIDAVIMQDLSWAPLIKEHFPNLEVHASTQSTIMNSESIRYWQKYVDVFVLARELTKEQIKEIKQKTNARLETFVHGHLCISYSGQCLISSLIGKRSGNRGMCASSCRKQYNGNNYLLSAKDLSLLASLKDVQESGIDTVKIEGRMKPAEYVAITTRSYREALNSLAQGQPKKIGETEINELKMAFNRNFTSGYFMGEKKIVDPLIATRRGIPLGIIKYHQLQLESDIEINDGIGFVTAGKMSGDYIKNITHINPNNRKEEHVRSAKRGDIVILDLPGFANGAQVFLTSKRYGKEVLGTPKKISFNLHLNITEGKIPIITITPQHNITLKKTSTTNTKTSTINQNPQGPHSEPNPITLTLNTPAQKATKYPLTKEQLKVEFEKYTSPYLALSEITITTDNSFIPKSELTTVRNTLDGTILNALAPSKETKISLPQPTYPKTTNQKKLLHVQIYSKEHAIDAINAGADIIYCDIFNPQASEIYQLVTSKNKTFGFHTPMVLKDIDIEKIKLSIKKTPPDILLINNVGLLNIQTTAQKIIGYQMNIFNDNQLTYYHTKAIASIELNLKELSEFNQKDKLIYYAHGAPVVMTFNENFETDHLTDKKMYTFKLKKTVTATEMLYSNTIGTLQHTKEILDIGITELFVDLTENVRHTVEYYKQVLEGKRPPVKSLLKNVTLGNLQKGVM